MANPDRILRQRDVTAMAAIDTMPHLVTRVRNLLSHGRRMAVTQRYTYVDQPPKVTAGLTVDTEARGGGIVEGAKAGEFHHFGVYLRPGLLAGFGFSAYASDNNTTEAEVWKRYHASKDTTDVWSERRRDMTEIAITGGLPGDGPARDDHLVIRAWNRDGVCDEKVVAFDYGPDRQQQRDDLALHLWTAGGGDPNVWEKLEWAAYQQSTHNRSGGVDLRAEMEKRAEVYAEADKILAVIDSNAG